MFFRFATYLSMDSLPESVKANLPPGMSASGMSINFMVQANLPVIGALLGQDWGNWRIDFGIYLTGPTKPLVKMLYQAPGMTEDPDFYLIKGQVFQIRGGGK